MMRVAAFVFLGALFAETACADSVLFGRAISHEYNPDAVVPCPEGYICMDGWFQWKIDARRTISGPPISGHISAAHIQHTNFTRDFQNRLRLFIVRPIKDADQRKLLKAEYILVDVSPVYEMYCIQSAPGEVGLELYKEDIYVAQQSKASTTYCFEEPELEQ